MSIIRQKIHANNFVILYKEVLNDSNLSFKAKGLWAYLMGLPDDWNINVREVANHSKDGYDSVRSGLNELVECGYAKMENQRESGKFSGGSWIIYETKQVSPQTETPYTENPCTVNSSTENPPLLSNKVLSIEKNKNIAPTQSKIGREQDICFSKEDKKFINITDQDLKAWSVAYPLVDIQKELVRAEQWVLSNPAKSNKKNWRRFLVTWLSKNNDQKENKAAYQHARMNPTAISPGNAPEPTQSPAVDLIKQRRRWAEVFVDNRATGLRIDLNDDHILIHNGRNPIKINYLEHGFQDQVKSAIGKLQ